MTELQIKILRFVALSGNPTFANIQSDAGLGAEALRTPLQELVTCGYLRMKDDDIDHDWAYRLTRLGRQMLAAHSLKPEA